MKVDEQESTRLIILSPQTSEEKIREAIREKIKKGTDAEAYEEELDQNLERQLLQQRILAIKRENIGEIKIGNPKLIEERFLKTGTKLKPRHARDIGHVMSLIKVLALLNLWFRAKDGSTITANERDIEQGFKVWEQISQSQDLGLPPYVYNMYNDVVLPAYRDKNKDGSESLGDIAHKGVTRQEIMKKHVEVYGRALPEWKLRQEILPMMENAGLVKQELDEDDRRNKLVYPMLGLTISPKQDQKEDDNWDAELES